MEAIMGAVTMSMSEVMDTRKSCELEVIEELSSLAVMKFNDLDRKWEFEMWLKEYGDEIERAIGLWFGENIDKDAQERERADVHRDYRRGYVKNGFVAN